MLPMRRRRDGSLVLVSRRFLLKQGVLKTKGGMNAALKRLSDYLQFESSERAHSRPQVKVARS